jgi:hypothetical protein
MEICQRRRDREKDREREGGCAGGGQGTVEAATGWIGLGRGGGWVELRFVLMGLGYMFLWALYF